MWFSQGRAQWVKFLFTIFVMTTEENKKKNNTTVVRTVVCDSLANVSASCTDFSGNTNLLVGPPAAARSLLTPNC